MADETNVGSIVAHLRIDDSEWNRVLRLAQERAEALGRVNPNIRITTNSAELQAQLRTINAQLDELKAENVSLRFDLTQAQAQIAKLREEAKRQGDKSGEDFGGAFNRSVQKGIREALAAIPKVDVDADTSPANRKLQEIRAQMDELGKKKIGVDITAAAALAKLKVLQEELDKLNRKSKDDIRIRVDTAAAAAKIAALRAEMEGLKTASSTDAGGAGGTGKLLVGAIVAGATLAGPLLAAATAGAVELGGAVGVAALAYKGLKDEEDRQTTTGKALQAQFHGIGAELSTLETIAARQAGPGVLAALGKVKAFMPELEGPVSGLAKHLGNALNIGTGGTVTALRTMLPLLDDGGTYAERLAQKWASFTASPQFAQFIDYARRELPIVGHDLADIGSAAVHLGVALQPYGDNLLQIIDLTAQAITKTSDLLALLNSNAGKSGGDNSDIFGFQKRYRDSKDKKDKGVLDYANIALGAGDPYADSGKAKQSEVEATRSAQAQELVATYARHANVAMAEEQSTLQGLANQYGTSVANIQAVSESEKKTAAQLALTTLAMQRQNDASGLLKAALDALDGKQMTAAQAQNAFEQSIVSGSQALESQKQAVKGQSAEVQHAATSVDGLSQAAIANRGSLLAQIQAAETAAGASGDLAKSTDTAKAKLVTMRQQVIDNAVAHGANRKAVTAFINTFLELDKLKPAKTSVDFVDAAARAKKAAFQSFLNSLPKSIRTAVALGGVSTAEYQLQLLARNRTATISVQTVGGQGVTGMRSVGGRAVAQGGMFKAYAQGGKEDHQPQIASTSPGTVRVWAEPETGGEAYIPLANDGRRGRAIEIARQTVAALGGHASFADGGLVTLTPKAPAKSGGGGHSSSHSGGSHPGASATKTPYEYDGIYYSTAIAAENARTRASRKKPKQVIESLVDTAGGGQAVGIASYIRGQVPSVAKAARLLSDAVDDAFKLKGVQNRIAATQKHLAAVRADLDNLQRDKSQLRTNVAGNLISGVDVSKYGDAGMLDTALQSGIGANNKFTAQINKLKAAHASKTLIERLSVDGPSAGLDTLTSESPAALKRTLALFGTYATSANRGGVAAGSIYDSRIAADQKKVAADNKLLATYTDQAKKTEAAMIKAVYQLAQMTKRPIKVSVGGREFAHAVIESGVVQGVMDDLTNTLKYGRR